MGSTTRTLVLVLLVALFAATGAAWWDSGWTYRQPINVTEQSGRTLQDYAVPIDPGLFPTQGLVGSWHFSAGEGDHVRDFSGHSNGGQLNGGTWSTGTRSAVQLQGGDHVALGNEADLGPSTLTLLVWLKPTGSNENEYIYDGRNHEFWLKEDDRTEKLQPGITINGNSRFFTMDTPLQQGQWYMAAMTYDGETLSAYLFNKEGRLVEEQHDSSMSGGIDQSSGSSRIGNYIGGGYGYAGAIDDVKLYNRALTEGTIRSMASSPSGPGLDGLRFATPDGAQLDYFHRYDDEVWVELPRLEADEQEQIHMYYGNKDARSRSSADDTLLFYDDFEDGTLNDSWIQSVGPVEVADADGDGDQEMVSNSHNSYVAIRDLQLRNGYVEAVTNSAGGGVNWINVRLITRTDCCSGNSLTFNLRDDDNDELWDNVTAADWAGPGGSFTSVPTESNTARYGGWFFEQDAEAFIDIDQDNTIDHTATTNDTVIEAGGIGITDFDGNVWYDNFLVRNYTRPEPTVSVGERQRRPGHNFTASSSHSLGGSLFNTETETLLGTARLGNREQDSSLVGYWPMNDRFGEVEDASGNQNDGHFGYSAMQFDGNDDYVRMNDSASLDVSEVTITAWVKRRQPCSDNAQVVNKLGGSAGYRLIACGGSNAVQFSYGDGSTYHHVSGTGGARRGEWSFVAVTFNGSKIGFMTDGNYTVVDAPASTLATNSQPVDIADPSTGLGSGAFEGTVDSVRIYNRDLSKQELLDLYNKQTVTSGLVMQQAFEEGPTQCDATSSNFCLTDDSSNTNTGEANGFNDNNWNTGSGWANDNPLWTVRGKEGIRGSNAFQFDGEDDYIVTSDNIGIHGTEPRTISVWFKTSKNSTWFLNNEHWAAFVDFPERESTEGSFMLVPSSAGCSDNSISIHMWASDTCSGVTLEDAGLGQWHHVVGTMTGNGQQRIYIDGQLEGNSSFTPSTPSGPVQIGRRSYSQKYYFHGKLDNVRIYSRALNGDEVTQLYDPSPGILSTSLLDGGRYTDWTNLSWDGTTPSGTDIETRVKSMSRVSIDTFEDLGTQANPGRSCLQIFRFTRARRDGLYWIDIDGQGGKPAFQAYCKMSHGSGGWRRLRLGAQVDSAYAAYQDFTIQSNQYTVKGTDTYSGDGSGWEAQKLLSDMWSFQEASHNISQVSSCNNGDRWYVRQYNSTAIQLGQSSYQMCADMGTRIFETYGRPESNYETFLSQWFAGKKNWITWKGRGGTSLRPVAQWRFDQGSGQIAADSVGGNQNGALGGSTSSQSSDPTWVEGCRYQGCLSFDGGDDYVNVGDLSSLDFGTGDVSLSVWFKIEDTGGTYRRLVGKAEGSTGGANPGYHIYVGSDGHLEWKVADGSEYEQAANSASVADGEWHHVVTTWDGESEQMEIYLDGEPVGSKHTNQGTINSISSSASFKIGKVGTDNNNFPGEIDDVRVYDKELSYSQVQTLYHSPSQSWQPISLQVRSMGGKPSPANLVGSYSFEGTGTTVADTSGSGNSGSFIEPDGYNIKAFKQVGSHTWNVPDGVTDVQVLVVGGGGGGGGSPHGGGGGAGGLIYRSDYQLPNTDSISVTVGAGGAGGEGDNGNWDTHPGGNGGDSTFAGLTAIGGGGGGGYPGNDGKDGGSGGGTSDQASPGVALQPGSADGGYGHDSIQGCQNAYSSGGGGAGQQGSPNCESDGGDGKYYGDIFGEQYGENGWFAGGGGGAIYSASGCTSNGRSCGGRGGGGNGGNDGSSAHLGTNAMPNTGGGGGGSERNSNECDACDAYGGDGGSGIVLVKYRKDGPERATGYSGQGMRFDGDSDYVDLGQVEGLPTGDAARTMCAWTYTTQDKRAAIIHQGPGDTTDGNFDLEANVYANGGTTNYYGIHYWGGGVRFDQQVVLDEWVHVCVSHEGGNLNNTNTDAYINGQSVQLLDSASINTASQQVAIGDEPNNEYNDVWYAGRIDEVRLYSTSLSQDQVSQLVQVSDFTDVLTNNTGSSFTPSGPYTQYKLNLLTGNSASLPTVERVTLAKTSDWSQWFDAGSNNALDLPPARYAQVQARLTSSDPTETPVLDSLSLGNDLALGSQSLFRRGTTVNTQADTSPGFLTTGDSNRTDSSLVGYWRFEDIDGRTILDVTGSGNSGTFYGMEINGTLGTGPSIDSSDPRWVPNCKRDGCLQFDGEQDYVTIENGSKLSQQIAATDAFTLSVWAKTTETGNDQWWVGTHHSTNDRILGIENGQPKVFIREDDQWRIADVTVNDGNWHHIVGMYDAPYLRIYVDGVQVDQWDVGTLDLGSTPGMWGIGEADGNEANLMSGYIDDVRVYDQALTAEEVNTTMHGSIVGEGLIGHWDLDTGYGQTAYNSAFQSRGIKQSSGIEFDGSDDYVTIDTNVSGRGDFAASAWVKFNEIDTDPGNLGSTVIRTNNDDFQWAIYGGNNDIRAYLNPWTGSSDSTILTYGGVQPDVWYHTLIQRDGNTFSLYINGQKVDSRTSGNVTGYIKGNSLRMGRPGGPAPYLNGTVDELRVYDRSLAPSEIQTPAAQADGLFTSEFVDFSSGTSWGLLNWTAALQPNTSIQARAHTASNVDRADSYHDWQAGTNSFSGSGDRLVGHWRFDDGQGTDSSGNDNHGNVLAGVDTSAAGFLPQSNAFRFDAESGSINVSDSNSLDIDESFTWSMWLNLDQIRGANDETVFGKRSAYELTIKRDRFKVVSWGDDWFPSYQTDLTDGWHHVVVTGQSDGSGRTLYIDGREVASGGPSYVMDNSSYPLQIGRWPSGDGNGIDGLLDDLRIYDSRLTQEQIRSIYTSQTYLSPWQDGLKNWVNWEASGGQPLKPMVHWKLDTGGGQQVDDALGDHNGTLGSNTSTESSDPTWTENCRYNGCLEFRYSDDDSVSFGDIPYGDSMTLSLWVKPSTFDGEWNSPYFARQDYDCAGGGHRQHGINIYANSVSNTWQFWAGTSDCASGWATVTTDLTQGWTHLALVAKNNSYLRGYVNGQLVGTVEDENISMYASNKDSIPSNLDFEGRIDDIKVYDRALSTSAVNALYHAPTASWQTDLVEVRARGQLPAPYQRAGSYSFEGTGQTVVDGAGRRSGVLGRNASLATDDPARVEGISGQALQFDGRNDMVGDIDRTFTGSHTVSFWFRTDELAGTDKKGIIGTTNFQNLVSVQDEYDTITWWTDTNNNGISSGIQQDTWYHGAIVYDGSVRTLYINGNKADSVIESRPSFSYTRIGSNVHGSFNGTIDEVTFYRTALSTAQINDLLQIGQFTEPLHNASGTRFQVAAENPLGQAFDPENFQYQASTLTGDSTSLVRLDTVETATVSSWSQWTSNASVLDLPDSRWIQLQFRLVGNATRAPLLDITRVKAAHGLINPEPDPGLTTFTNSSTNHAFNVTTPATDLNGGRDITSCRVFASDGDGNGYSFTGTVDTTAGGVTAASCHFSRIDTTLSGFQPTEQINVTVQFTDTAGNQVNATTASNTIPNRVPRIVDITRYPLVPDLGDNVSLLIEANDTEETTVYANFTFREDGSIIVNNTNGTLSLAPNGNQLWNSTEFTLDDKNATYSMTVTVSDGWSTTERTVLLSLDARPPNVTNVATRIPTPWNLRATHFRPGDDIGIRATVTDINTAANLDRYYFNITSPRGQVAAFQPLSETASIFNGYNLSGRYETFETMAAGTWNVTVAAVDNEGLLDANTTSFTMQRFDNTTLGMNYSIDQSTAYVDGGTVSGTGTRTDLGFPYFVAEGNDVLSGVVNYGRFQRLAYETSGDSYQANMTQAYGSNRFLVPISPISLFELEQLEDAFTGSFLSGRNFLQSTTSSFVGGRSDEKHVEVTLSYHDRPNIDITGFKGSLSGIQTLIIQRGPIANNTVHIRITR